MPGFKSNPKFCNNWKRLNQCQCNLAPAFLFVFFLLYFFYLFCCSNLGGVFNPICSWHVLQWAGRSGRRLVGQLHWSPPSSKICLHWQFETRSRWSVSFLGNTIIGLTKAISPIIRCWCILLSRGGCSTSSSASRRQKSCWRPPWPSFFLTGQNQKSSKPWSGSTARWTFLYTFVRHSNLPISNDRSTKTTLAPLVVWRCLKSRRSFWEATRLAQAATSQAASPQPTAWSDIWKMHFSWVQTVNSEQTE